MTTISNRAGPPVTPSIPCAQAPAFTLEHTGCSIDIRQVRTWRGYDTVTRLDKACGLIEGVVTGAAPLPRMSRCASDSIFPHRPMSSSRS